MDNGGKVLISVVVVLAIVGGALAYYHREEGRWPWQPKPEKKAHVSLTPSLTVRYPNRTEIIREPKKLGRTKGLSYVLDNGIQEIDFGWDIHVIVTKNGEPIETPIDFDIDADVNSDGIDIVWSESSEFPYYPENVQGRDHKPRRGSLDTPRRRGGTGHRHRRRTSGVAIGTMS